MRADTEPATWKATGVHPDEGPPGQPDGPPGAQSPLDSAFRESVARALHDLNNVISVVQLCADLLERQAVEPADAAATIREQVLQATRIIEKLHPRSDDPA